MILMPGWSWLTTAWSEVPGVETCDGTVGIPRPEYSCACCCCNSCRFCTAWATARSMPTMSDNVGRDWARLGLDDGENSGTEGDAGKNVGLEYMSDLEAAEFKTEIEFLPLSPPPLGLLDMRRTCSNVGLPASLV